MKFSLVTKLICAMILMAVLSIARTPKFGNVQFLGADPAWAAVDDDDDGGDGEIDGGDDEGDGDDEELFCSEPTEQTRSGDPDGDGLTGEDDCCPFDVEKDFAGECGCGKSDDDDADEDFVPDCVDACPTDPFKDEDAGVCGCGVEDLDENENGVIDCLEQAVSGSTAVATAKFKKKKNKVVADCSLPSLGSAYDESLLFTFNFTNTKNSKLITKSQKGKSKLTRKLKPGQYSVSCTAAAMTEDEEASDIQVTSPAVALKVPKKEGKTATKTN